MAGARAPLLVLPTGGGKTVVFSHVAASAAGMGRRVLVLVHRRELVRQSSAKLLDAGVEHGIIAPGHTATRDLVQVASVQTLARRLGDARYQVPDLIVVDEAHHAIAGQWATVLAAYPRARVLGVTATPERLDGKGLGIEAGGCFDALVLGPSVEDLIAGGFLTPSRVFAPAKAVDLSDVRTVRGDYDPSALAEAMATPKIVGDAVEHYAKHAAGLPAILFSPSVAHAAMTAEAFRAAGWRAVAASGETPTAERDAAIAGLATGAVQVLCSCDLISEGLDVPAVGAVILLRPTKSVGLYLQQVGRGLRPAPGKSALIVLDHAGNTLRHGMPDAPRAWSLKGKPRKEKGEGEKAPPARQCPECYAVHEPAPECPECGFVYEAPKRDIEHVAGDLAEVDQARMNALRTMPYKRAVGQAKTRQELEELARARGYKPGWVWRIMQSRAAEAGGAAAEPRKAAPAAEVVAPHDGTKPWSVAGMRERWARAQEAARLATKPGAAA